MAFDQQNDIQQLRNLVIRYLSRWYIFAACITFCLAVAVFYYLSHPKSFHVSSTIMIKSSEDNNSFGLQQIDMLQSMGLFSGQRLTDDEVEILTSKTIMEHVVRDLDIQTIYKVKKGLKWIETYPKHPIDIVYPADFQDTARYKLQLKITRKADGYKVKLKYDKLRGTYFVQPSQPFATVAGVLTIKENGEIEKGDKFLTIFKPLALWAEQYLTEIKIGAVKRESNVVKLSTSSSCVARAKDMLNKIVELYNIDAVEYKNRMARATGLFLDERLSLISEELADVENDVEKYKRDNNLTDLKTEAELFLETASEYQRQMAQITTQKNIVSYVRDYIRQTPEELIPANLGIEDMAVVELVTQYNTSMLTRQRLQRSTTADNPVITQLDRQLASIRDNLLSTINSVIQSLEISYNDARAKDNAFMARIHKMPTQEREYIEIKRQQQVKEALYLFLIQKREENAMALASSLQPARTIDAADYTRKPIAPRLKLLFIVACIAGFVLALIIIIGLDLIFNTISSSEEFKRLIVAKVIGEISTSRSKKNIVVNAHSTSSTAELFRLLRTNLNFMLKGHEHPVVLVTSTSTGEGKSFVSSNLAASFALTGKRVLLVGLDIRSPKLAQYLNAQGTGHLTEYLAGEDYSLEQLITPYAEDPRLNIAPAGAIPPNPGELLMSDRLDVAINQWKTQYDIIIIDSAPVGMVSDTYLLNRFADITLYVSRLGLTPRAAADFINEQVKDNKLNNIACIVNGIPTKARYGSYGYGYGDKNDE